VTSYEPKNPKLQRVKSRLTAASWNKRIEAAEEAETVVKRILGRVKGGVSLNRAIEKELPPSRRSWALRRVPAYRKGGLETLIDRRLPREPQVSMACRRVVQGEREANRRVTKQQVLKVLKGQRIQKLPSDATIKREFARVDERRKYAQSKGKEGPEVKTQPVQTEVIELPLAGGELLMAAEQETRGMAALTEMVLQLAEQAKEDAQGQEPVADVDNRNKRGQFTAKYNRLRRREAGEPIASYLLPAQDKAQGRVPTWPRFVQEGAQSLGAKVRMLTLGWLVAESKGWDALRAPAAAGLEPLTGFSYMPSTLSKHVSALAISGAGDPLLLTVGNHWHHVAQQHFGESGAMAALYIDNHCKEVWSSLFTNSGKVSKRSRVMPCITTTYAHTGAGTPAVLSVQSGGAPLAPRLVSLVEQAQQVLGDEVRRAVVIDAEGSTFDLLESFAKARRIIVTPLRPSRTPELELRYSRGSYYRAYREHDELRIAACTLVHRSSGRSLELHALLVRREHRDSDTVLLTTGINEEMEGRTLADLYYQRWPVQENSFKEGAALWLDQHRGNCGVMVANVAVITELERLADRTQRDENILEKLTAEETALQQAAAQTEQKDCSAQKKLGTRRLRLDALIARGKTEGKTFVRVAVEHQQVLVQTEKTTKAARVAAQRLQKNQKATVKLEQRLGEMGERVRHLDSKRTIRQLDVEQDKILTAAKLTALQLIAFVLRVYLLGLPMTPETFVSRVFPLRGRKEIEPEVERVFFYENLRDPEVTVALKDACDLLNQRNLRRDGRRLLYSVGPPPRDSQFS
jgi:hypothetical protein